jgi:hypothetical protein
MAGLALGAAEGRTRVARHDVERCVLTQCAAAVAPVPIGHDTPVPPSPQ